jgi:hypothetical protein
MLRREADTRREWNADSVRSFLHHEVRSKAAPAAAPRTVARKTSPAKPEVQPSSSPAAADIVRRTIERAEPKLFEKTRDCVAKNKDLPGTIVAQLYEIATEIIGHKPKPAESRKLRQALKEALSKTG